MADHQKQELEAPPGRFVPVYITSKRIHAGLLLDLRKRHPKIHFTARWPVLRDISSEQMTPARIWQRDNADDIVRSDVVLCYAEKEDRLCGSLFELGVAWAHGKPICCVGENEGFKEWVEGAGARRVATLDEALEEVARRLDYAASSEERLTKQIDRMGEKLHAQIATALERPR